MVTNADPLPSWNETPTREAIMQFVQSITTEGGPDYVRPQERVATFDNDGTLWCEKPMPIQLDFTLRRFMEMATADPDLREQQPWKAAYEQDFAWLNGAIVKHYRGDNSDLMVLMNGIPRAFGGMSVEEYEARVDEFFESAQHPTFGRSYLTCGYQPMVELLRYLEANGFTAYIASGGDRDFMRPAANRLYGIPRERVIGSTQALDYADDKQGGALMYKSEMEFFDDGPTKPIRIWSRVGRRPIVAGGNSNGDDEMLAFGGGPGRPALRLLLLHDDAEREFDYVAGAEIALARAKAEDWTVVSIKNDWASVFSNETILP
jgi:hypothetical protein